MYNSISVFFQQNCERLERKNVKTIFFFALPPNYENHLKKIKVYEELLISKLKNRGKNDGKFFGGDSRDCNNSASTCINLEMGRFAIFSYIILSYK
jgi:hypothetical protein